MLVAPNQDIEATIGHMRKTYARDLILETVTPETSGEKKEHAVYVVNPTGGPNSRLVADLSLDKDMLQSVIRKNSLGS
jgi:hypothetical protein